MPMPTNVLKRLAPIALRLTGPLLFLALLAWVVDPGDLVDTLRDVDAGWAIATVVAFHAVILLRTARWIAVHRLFALRHETLTYHARLSYATSLTAVTLPQFLSPFARFVMLAQDGQPRARAAGASLLEKASELGAYVAFGIAGLCYFAIDHEPLRWTLVAASVAVGFGAIVGWLLRAQLRAAIDRLVAIVRDRLGAQAVDAVEGVADQRHARAIATIAVAAIAVAAAQATASYFATRAVGLDLSLWFVAAAWGLVALSMLLPISVNGIGTREGIYVATFATAGVSRDAAFAASIVVVAAAIVASLPGALEIAYRLMFPRRAPRDVDPIVEDRTDVPAGAGPA